MALNQLIGGAFQDIFQTPLANGYLILELRHSSVNTNGYTYEDTSTTTQQITGGAKIKIPLDSSGNIVTSPTYSVFTNDSLTPDSYYLVSCYTSNGQLVWGPNAERVLASPSPFDIGAWVPHQPPSLS